MVDKMFTKEQLFLQRYQSLSKGKLDRKHGIRNEMAFNNDKFYQKGWLIADREVARLIA